MYIGFGLSFSFTMLSYLSRMLSPHGKWMYDRKKKYQKGLYDMNTIRLIRELDNLQPYFILQAEKHDELSSLPPSQKGGSHRVRRYSRYNQSKQFTKKYFMKSRSNTVDR